MKAFQVLASILSATALAGGITLSSANATGCPFSKTLNKSANSSQILPSSGTDKLNPWKQAGTAGFVGFVALLGFGVAYKSCRAGQQAQAAFAAMNDHFDINELEEEIIDEVREHPEAPGGELDLTVDLSAETMSELKPEAEVALVK